MSDNRRNAGKEQVRRAIIKILESKPLQAKDLRTALKKMVVGYSRDRLNDLLNQMMDEGEIKRILNNTPYPVYTVTKKSKILAEISGIDFHLHFKQLFIERPELIEEFGLTKKTKSNPDALIQFFGFYVLGSLCLSRAIKKEQRYVWLSHVLDLEKSLPMSTFFEAFVEDHTTIMEVMRALKTKYEKNFSNISQTFLNTMFTSLQIEKNKKFPKIFKDYVDDWGKMKNKSM